MITDDEIEQLPEDPESAFVEFERIIRDRTNQQLEQTENSGAAYCLEYINRVLAAAKVYEIDGLKNQTAPRMDGSVFEEYHQFKADVDFVTTQLRLRRIPRNRKNSVGLDGNTKAKIHAHIQKIRLVLDNAADIPEAKRDLLFKRLNAFALEVDKVRTNLQSVADVYLTVCTVIGEGFNRLEAARRFLDTIASLMGKAKEAEDSLRAALPPPPKQLEPPREHSAPDSDDETSF